MVRTLHSGSARRRGKDPGGLRPSSLSSGTSACSLSLGPDLEHRGLPLVPAAVISLPHYRSSDLLGPEAWVSFQSPSKAFHDLQTDPSAWPQTGPKQV